jgi:hypothetical protein
VVDACEILDASFLHAVLFLTPYLVMGELAARPHYQLAGGASE